MNVLLLKLFRVLQIQIYSSQFYQEIRLCNLFCKIQGFWPRLLKWKTLTLELNKFIKWQIDTEGMICTSLHFYCIRVSLYSTFWFLLINFQAILSFGSLILQCEKEFSHNEIWTWTFEIFDSSDILSSVGDWPKNSWNLKNSNRNENLAKKWRIK